MTVRGFIQQIQRLAGDKSGVKCPFDIVLQYMSEEMTYCAKVFPTRISVTDTISDNTITASKIRYIAPRFVYVDNSPCAKIYATDMARCIALGGGCERYWSMDGGVLKIWPSTGTAMVVGGLKTPTYTISDLDKEFGVIVDPATDTTPPYIIPGLTGAPLTVVRYRTAQRVAEDIEDFQRAQYLLQMAAKAEREARASFEDSTTSSINSMTGEDIIPITSMRVF